MNWYPLQKVRCVRRKLTGANPATITWYDALVLLQTAPPRALAVSYVIPCSLQIEGQLGKEKRQTGQNFSKPPVGMVLVCIQALWVTLPATTPDISPSVFLLQLRPPEQFYCSWQPTRPHPVSLLNFSLLRLLFFMFVPTAFRLGVVFELVCFCWAVAWNGTWTSCMGGMEVSCFPKTSNSNLTAFLGYLCQSSQVWLKAECL